MDNIIVISDTSSKNVQKRKRAASESKVEKKAKVEYPPPSGPALTEPRIHLFICSDDEGMHLCTWDASKATYWQEIEAAFGFADKMDLDGLICWIGRTNRLPIDAPHLRATLSKIPNDVRAKGWLVDPMYDDEDAVTQIGSTYKTWVYTTTTFLH